MMQVYLACREYVDSLDKNPSLTGLRDRISNMIQLESTRFCQIPHPPSEKEETYCNEYRAMISSCAGDVGLLTYA